ncbi:MAG: recombinase family protein, partial [Elusimicrobia bacterium]|nr:recombinase family protein [Elusimicrobiota bacterium]
MKIAIYLRVSTEDQAKEGYSLEVQMEYLETFAKKENYQIYKVYSDDGISGYTSERPALQELLEDAKAKRFELVLVYKIDRFSRNLKDLLNLVYDLSANGVGFKSATEPFDTTTSAGKLMFQQLGSFAEFERNRIAERVFPGMIKGVQKGNWQGARYSPFGYTYDKQEKLLKIEEKDAELVKQIYKMFIDGKSIRNITAHLTRKGYRNRMGNIFSTKLIGDILRNRIYTGKLVWNVHHYDKNQKTKKGLKYIKNSSDKIVISQGKHQPIVSEQDFEAVQKIIGERRVCIKQKNSGHVLSGILYCAKCNHKYVGVSTISNHRTGTKKMWYRCNGPNRSFIKCKNRCVKAEIIEPQVARLLETLLKSDKLTNSRWMCMTEKASIPPTHPKTDLSEYQKKLKLNLEKQSKLTDTYLENVISDEVYRQKIETLRWEEEELKKILALEEMRVIEREKSEEYLDRVDAFVSDYKAERGELDSFTKKQVLNLLFKNIKIADKKILSFEFFSPFNVFFEQKNTTLCQIPNQSFDQAQ